MILYVTMESNTQATLNLSFACKIHQKNINVKYHVSSTGEFTDNCAL